MLHPSFLKTFYKKTLKLILQHISCSLCNAHYNMRHTANVMRHTVHHTANVMHINCCPQIMYAFNYNNYPYFAAANIVRIDIHYTEILCT